MHVAFCSAALIFLLPLAGAAKVRPQRLTDGYQEVDLETPPLALAVRDRAKRRMILKEIAKQQKANAKLERRSKPRSSDRELFAQREKERAAKREQKIARDLDIRKEREEKLLEEKELWLQRNLELHSTREEERVEAKDLEYERLLQMQLNDMTERMWSRAVARRKEAELAAYVVGKEDQLGLLKAAPASEAAKAAVVALNAVVNDGGLLNRTRVAADQLKTSIARTVRDFNRNAATFVNNSQQHIDNRAFAFLLATFVADGIRLEWSHQQDAASFSAILQDQVPSALRTHLEQVLASLKPATHPLDAAATKLAFTSPAQACAHVVDLQNALAAPYAKLEEVQGVLNTTAATLPLLGVLTPDHEREAKLLLKTIVSLGFMELLGMEEIALGITQTVAPVVQEKFNC